MPTKHTLNLDALVAALDAQRRARNLSWRQLAADASVSPSLLSRMRNNQKPDSDGLATLVNWLGVPAEMFFQASDDVEETSATPELETQLAPLLRARRDFSEAELAFLENVIESSIRLVKTRRGIEQREDED